MSLSIADLLNLPSLSNAEVVAGKKGLYKNVDSISVLEYPDPIALQDELFKNSKFYGSEIVITGFVYIKDDVDAQYKVIRRLHEMGEVGLILYYVGIFLPCIDKKVIELADELGFSIICMPKNRMDLRYSEVIYEVVEAILKEKKVDIHLVSEMLERISLLPVHQRSMDTVLRMLSDRMTCSLYLTDYDFVSMNMANWPRISNVKLTDIGKYYGNDYTRIPKEPDSVFINRDICICSHSIKSEKTSYLYLIIVKEDGILSEEICRQAAEVVQLFINIWSQGHGNIGTEELIRAILNDEPMKMRRLAEIFHIDVRAIQHLLIVKQDKTISDSGQINKINQYLKEKTKTVIEKFFEVSLVGNYNDCFVIFLGKAKVKNSCEMITECLLYELEDFEEKIILVSNFALENTREVRSAYIMCSNYLQQARCIYPNKCSITLQELQFAKKCQDVIDKGEDSIKETLHLLSPIEKSGKEQRKELYTTLEIFMLDSGLNVSKTAEKLFLHKNTIKYRIKKLNEKFNFHIDKMPESYDLYKAVALRRLLKNKSKLS
ncbi:PucR family transcriptional regulator [Vallitalea guaymasensis]|uniref:PucR family transcriptional regulator n=1 Tax=Vallitalea guaymasensis TaxID=1185412 RepID=UPI002357EA51|nr:PucR family transcriptional regulator [Vallitalea guaymasensis]